MVWMYDVSKQGFGAMFIHVWNILLSIHEVMRMIVIMSVCCLLCVALRGGCRCCCRFRHVRILHGARSCFWRGLAAVAHYCLEPRQYHSSDIVVMEMFPSS